MLGTLGQTVKVLDLSYASGYLLTPMIEKKPHFYGSKDQIPIYIYARTDSTTTIVCATVRFLLPCLLPSTSRIPRMKNTAP